MGFKTVNGSLEGMSAYVSRLPNEILEDLEVNAAEDLAHEGADLMREYISTRGTERSGKEGREETGLMLRRVRSRVRQLSGKRIRLEWGWLSDRKAYFRYQENGFRHYRSGEDVEPMHALLDSYLKMGDRFQDEMRKRFRR